MTYCVFGLECVFIVRSGNLQLRQFDCHALLQDCKLSGTCQNSGLTPIALGQFLALRYSV